MMSKSNRSISSLMAIAISGALFFTALGFFLATGVDSPTFTQADELWIDGNGSAGVEAQGPDFASVAEKMKPTVVHVVAVGKSLRPKVRVGMAMVVCRMSIRRFPLILRTRRVGPVSSSAQMAMCLSLIHISEPTRRTPISYAVFCLKKKKKK